MIQKLLARCGWHLTRILPPPPAADVIVAIFAITA